MVNVRARFRDRVRFRFRVRVRARVRVRFRARARHLYIFQFVENQFTKCIYFLSEKAMAPHSSTLAWKIPWTEEPGRLQSKGSRRVRHD